MSYNRIIFLPPQLDMSAERLDALLSTTFGTNKNVQILSEENRTVIKWADWEFRVYYECGPDILQESQEIASSYAGHRPDQESLSICNKWITIASDNDYEMVHFNDFIFLLQDLEEELPGAVMFVPEEGTFFDVGEFNWAATSKIGPPNIFSLA